MTSDGGPDADCEGGKCDSVNSGDAVCTVSIVGAGRVDVEREYLPRVIACENGNAGPEALKAQAIAARSYLYYVVKTERRALLDGQGDQVYSCSKKPGPEHFRAVDDSSGQVLKYKGANVATFFVAGAFQQGPSCTGGTSDPTNTERFVTYNSGQSGDGITQSKLGWINPGNHANRGCMSQLGANCHSDQGMSAEQILRFYYGEDIEFKQSSGGCIDDDGPIDAPEEFWIGDACDTDEQCDFNANGEEATCYDWFNENTNTLGGFCSVTCEGFCPDNPTHANSMCVDLDAGRGFGRCAAEAMSINSFCADIPGTVARLQSRYIGDSGARDDWRTMCVPPDAPKVICDTGSQLGECIDTSLNTCSGTLHTGLCPSSSAIRCCTP